MIAIFVPVVEEFSMTHSRHDMKPLYKNVHRDGCVAYCRVRIICGSATASRLAGAPSACRAASSALTSTIAIPVTTLEADTWRVWQRCPVGLETPVHDHAKCFLFL